MFRFYLYTLNNVPRGTYFLTIQECSTWNIKRMKIFITGATGKVGEAITKFLSKETDWDLVLQTTSGETIRIYNNRTKVAKFDLAEKKLLKKIILDEKPDVIINTAAMTNVDLCEDEKKIASEINTKVVESLVGIANKINAKLITFSTDYIFNGEKGPYSEYDLPDPISYYGKTKLAADNFVIGNLVNYAIIRTNVVYGISSYGKNDFVRWVLESLLEKKEIKIINGQYCNPTFADDIAYGVFKIIERNLRGIYNIAGKDYLNRYEIACTIADTLNLNKNLITEVPYESLVQKAKRPHRGGLIILKAESEFGFTFSTLSAGILSLKLQMKT